MKQLKLLVILVLISFLIINCCDTFLPVHTKETSELFDNIYKDCQNHHNFNQVCYGWSAVNGYQCIKSATCEYLVIVDTFPPKYKSQSPLISDLPSFVSISDEQLNINLYIVRQQSNISYNVWLTNNEESHLYQCRPEDEVDSSDEPTSTSVSVKKVIPVAILGTDSFVSGCSWSVSRRNLEWPLNEKKKPIDLINSPYWLVLGSTLKEDNETKSRVLPIYRLKYLYQDCDQRTKFCYGANNCVNNFSCSELMVVKLREYDDMYLDFLFLVLEPLEKTSYTIDIKPSSRIIASTNDEPNRDKEINNQQVTINGQLLSLRSECDQTSCRHKVILPNDTLEMKIDENLLAHSYNQMIGSTRKSIWSLPLVFEVDGQSSAASFNGKNTMYQVTIRSNNLTLIESKIPGLPGYSLREDIYKECETINSANEQSATSSICYGFNKANQRQECLKCSSCSMVAILKPLLKPIASISNTSNHGIYHEAIELQLFGHEVNTSSIGLQFIYNREDGSSFGYQCMTNKRQDRSQLNDQIGLIGERQKKETESVQKISQRADETFGPIYCQFIISGDQGTWPLMKNGEAINLIRAEIPISVNWNHYSKLIDPNGSRNPIHRFKYLYNSCLKKEENVLCIGFNDCIVHRNCTNLVVIKYEKSDQQSSLKSSSAINGHGQSKMKSSHKRDHGHKPKQEEESHGMLKWSVYSADESDSLVVSFSGDNLYGDDYAIMCTPEGFTEHYIWETGKLKPIRETVIRETQRKEENQLIPGSGLEGFRCFWAMPGLFSVFFQNYRFDVITDTVYMNVTFQKDKRPTHATRIFTTLPGFRGNKGPNSGSNCHLSPLIVKLSFTLLFFNCWFNS